MPYERLGQAMPPLAFIDHSIVTHEPSWAALEALVSGGHAQHAQLVLSVWNLYEIGQAGDRAQQDRRLAFLARQSPVWAVERCTLQQKEVERFLYQHYFHTAPSAFDVIVLSLSMMHYHSSGRYIAGLTPRQWIDGVDFKRLDKLKDLSPNALKTLQSAGPQVVKAKQQEMFRAWIRNLIPTFDPNRRALKKTEIEQLLDFCEAHSALFLSECKSLAVEDALTRARTSDPKRKPLRSDGPDLQHAVAALAYGNLFLVRDGFVRNCSQYAIKNLAGRHSLAAVFATPDEASKEVGHAA